MSYSKEIKFSIEIESNEVIVINADINCYYTIDPNSHFNSHSNEENKVDLLYVKDYYESIIDIVLDITNNNEASFSIKDIYNISHPYLVLKCNKRNVLYEIRLKKILSKKEIINKLSILDEDFDEKEKLSNILIKCINNEFKITDYNENTKNKNDFLLGEFNKLNFYINELTTPFFNRYSSLMQKFIDSHGEEILIRNTKIIKKKANSQGESLSEIDIKYSGLIGIDYCCKGINNGCSKGTVYGSNPYTTDSNFCSAALHSGIITENGGLYNLKRIGSLSSYTSSINNGISSLNWNSPWEGVSIHKSDVEILAHKIFDYCGQYNGS